MLKEKLMRAWRKVKMTWLLLLSLLSGCATALAPCAPGLPTPPSPPSLTQPLPSATYLRRASGNIETWRKRLTDTQATSKP